MSFEKSDAEKWLDSAWRSIRDGWKGQYIDRIHGALALLEHLGVLTSIEVEGWRARLDRCPGHDDEGGRDWCGYCGKMRKAEGVS